MDSASASSRRGRNFTEREKVLLLNIVKDLVIIIDNKKTDGTSVAQKNETWDRITDMYNAASETGPRTSKQLHALYDNLKKKARRNLSDDKCERYKTGGGTFVPKTTLVDETVVGMLQTHFDPLVNHYDSSSVYYKKDIEQNSDNNPPTVEIEAVPLNLENKVVPSGEENPPLASGHSEIGIAQNINYQEALPIVEVEVYPYSFSSGSQENSLNEDSVTVSASPQLQSQTQNPRRIPTARMSLTERKKKSISTITNAMVNRKSGKLKNEDLVTKKKVELLQIQIDHEKMRNKRSIEILEADLKLKLSHQIQIDHEQMKTKRSIELLEEEKKNNLKY